jgi:hypothetical protein
MTNQCCSCFATFSQTTTRGQCFRCGSDAIATVEDNHLRELHRQKRGHSYTVEIDGRISIAEFPALTFTNGRDANNFVRRVELRRAK